MSLKRLEPIPTFVFMEFPAKETFLFRKKTGNFEIIV